MIEIICHISSGVIVNQPAFNRAISELDGRYVVKITKANKRSLPQNNFYWGCVCPIVRDALRDAGYSEVKSINDAHEVMKTLFLKKKITNEVNGDEIIIPGSTAKLTTTEFVAFFEEVAQWSSTYLGVVIPNPNSQASIQF